MRSCDSANKGRVERREGKQGGGKTYGSDSQTKLAHGVEGRWASVEDLLDELGNS